MSTQKQNPVILLVDDDEDDRSFFARAVRKSGYGWRVAMAANGREALEYLSGGGKYADREIHPVATHVLLDLKMPGVSGIEVLQWIRSRPLLETLPVIILSSSREPSDKERTSSLGIDGYEVKPVEFAALVATVQRIAHRWQLTGAPALSTRLK